jgi:chromosome segregation ATPase
MQIMQEYQKQLAGMDKKIAEGEAEIRGLHAKIAQASQEHTRAEKELQAAKKEAEAERLAKEDALETVAKLKQLLAEADSRRSRVFRAIRAGETNEDRAKRLGRPLNAFEEKLDYGAILGQLRKTGLKPIDRDS